MSFPTSAACYVVVLNQQEQQNTDQYNQSLDDEEVNHGKTMPRNCTVVEHGRVVVKPLQTPINEAE